MWFARISHIAEEPKFYFFVSHAEQRHKIDSTLIFKLHWQATSFMTRLDASNSKYESQAWNGRSTFGRVVLTFLPYSAIHWHGNTSGLVIFKTVLNVWIWPKLQV
jgi:hypothetical protein